MGASELIGRLALVGVTLTADGEQLIAQPRTALTAELCSLIRENKPALLAALVPLDGGIQLRRERALAKLALEPDKQRIAIFDSDAERDFVICTVAIRTVGTCEFRIPRERYDPWAVLEAIQRSEQ